MGETTKEIHYEKVKDYKVSHKINLSSKILK